MDNNYSSPQHLACTACGTILVILAQINNGELVKTAVLAALGAVVSYSVSLVMRKLFGKRKNS